MKTDFTQSREERKEEFLKNADLKLACRLDYPSPLNPELRTLNRSFPLKHRLTLFQKRRNALLLILGRKNYGEQVDLAPQAFVEVRS